MKRRILYALILAVFCSVSARALTILAPDARIKTIGGPQQGGWNLWSAGELGDSFQLPQPGIYTISVQAKGSPCDGVLPLMAFKVGGEIRKTVSVEAGEYKTCDFELNADATVYRITVAFLNDALSKTEDRNLYIKSISITGPDGAPEVRLADDKAMEQWQEKQKEIEREVVEQARAEIVKVRTGQAELHIVNAAGEPVPDAAVSAELVGHDFLFGCNIFKFNRFDSPEKNDQYKKLFADLFNYATTGFYWRSYEWQQGKPNYAYTDQVVEWCTQKGIAVKGHPLLWDHEAARPRWNNDQQPSPEVQKQRVQEIIRRYSGKINYWEVVNEPAHATGVKIDQPYRWAKEADANAYLIVNDYYVMGDGCPPFFELLENAIDSDVPFEGIGIQAHEPRTDRFPLDKVRRILAHYATLGKDLHITEFTPTSSGQKFTGTPIAGVWDEAAQADYAVKFYTVCFANPVVVGITWWDFCDDGSWLEGGGMLRKDLSEKHVYTALKKLIHEDWHTSTAGKTDADGTFGFRGFYGTYRVTIEAGGEEFSKSVHFGKEDTELVVTLE